MRLNEIHEIYKDRVHFCAVYIVEAHPDDGWRVPVNLEKKIHVNAPTNDAERTTVAALCQRELELPMKMLIDTIDDEVEKQYIAQPMRLFAIDAAGKIAYNGAQGPFGYDLEEWAGVIEGLVG